MRQSSVFSAPLAETARSNLKSVIRDAVRHPPDCPALLVFDRDSPLARLLATAYETALPEARAIEFSETKSDEVLGAAAALSPGDLVVLVESSRFPLAAHRFRVELFEKGLKVIEHPHLGRIQDSELAAYVDSLAYDATYYRAVGPELKRRIDRATGAKLVGASGPLVYDGPLEAAKLNIGDYTGQVNIGGQFPIGEVFTESRDLASVSGTVELFAFGAADFSVVAPESPIRLRIEAGRIAAAESAPRDFDSILAEIRDSEGEVWLRELGFGMNRAFTRERRVSDVGSYERMCGIHLSLGAKHAIYAKPGFSKRRVKYHVDVFAAVERAEIDGETVYADGKYVV